MTRADEWALFMAAMVLLLAFAWEGFWRMLLGHSSATWYLSVIGWGSAVGILARGLASSLRERLDRDGKGG